jgi:hypothetical protein
MKRERGIAIAIPNSNGVNAGRHTQHLVRFSRSQLTCGVWPSAARSRTHLQVTYRTCFSSAKSIDPSQAYLYR